MGLAVVAAACGGNSAGSNPTAAIKTLVAQVGMTGAEVDACLELTGTPTFIIGSQTIVGAWPFATYDAVLKSLTQ